MDGLIVLLIIIGVISSISKSNKKKKKKAAAKPAPSRASAPADVKVPYSREEWSRYLKENHIEDNGEKAEELAASMKELEQAAEKLPHLDVKLPGMDRAGKALAGFMVKANRRAAQETAASIAPPTPKSARTAVSASGSIALDPGQDIEGESEAEHAEHRRRAVETEIFQEGAAEAREALRNVNLRTLRAAVVMKEVLDRPVALRPRRRY